MELPQNIISKSVINVSKARYGTMNDKEQLVRDMFANLFAAPEKYFNPTSKFYIWGPGHPPAVGPEAMKKEMSELIVPLSDIKFDFVSFASVGNKVFSDRIDSFTVDGHRVTVGVVGVGEIGPDNRFVTWVDYFDVMPFARFKLSPTEAGGVKKL
jgi:limonene-1,2-epoxide hydrolase